MTSAILDKLADSVNRLAKHFACVGRMEATMSLSALLCGKECGLAPALEAIFTHGIRSFGVFQRRRLYAWDFFGMCEKGSDFILLSYLITRLISLNIERFVENQQQIRDMEAGKIDSPSMQIGGFDVSFVTSPRFSRTLPRSGGLGPRNVDSIYSRRAPPPSNGRMTNRGGSALPPLPSAATLTRNLGGGWQSQPCSPGMALQRRHCSTSTRSIFALENFISTFHLVNRGGAHIGKLGKFQVRPRVISSINHSY